MQTTAATKVLVQQTVLGQAHPRRQPRHVLAHTAAANIVAAQIQDLNKVLMRNIFKNQHTENDLFSHLSL